MKISYHWLQTFFKEPLPSPEAIAELFNFHAFEVESITPTVKDVILDIKVLPDRAPYCLSHQGIARELSAFIPNKFIPRGTDLEPEPEKMNDISIEIEDKKFCERYVVARVLDINKHESPEWLRTRLEAVGQRSINLLVDLANFVMLDIGEPMHAFDAEKIKGNIYVRKAKDDESIVLLDGKEVKLDPSMFVIADELDPLAIAGIKGGKRAEVGKGTKHIILEAAHFNPTAVRKTSDKLGIKNDSSKRFENNVSGEYAPIAMNYFLSLLSKEDEKISIGSIVDLNHSKLRNLILSVPIEFIQEYLGGDLKGDAIIDALNRGNIPSERGGEKIIIRVPEDRPDISIKEDVADEVGRIIGYQNIKGILPAIKTEREANKEISWKNEIRNFLVKNGYSEVYTYALKDKGEMEIENPLASDKSYLRENLSDALEEKLLFNTHNVDFLGLEKIRIFEIGKIFPKGGEKTSLVIGIAHKKPDKKNRPNDEIKILRDELFEFLKVSVQNVCTVDDTGGLISHKGKQIGVINNKDGIMELDLDYLISILPTPSSETNLLAQDKEIKYEKFSIFPFASRDIAVFVPGEGKEEEVLELIKKHGDSLLVRETLFDVFSKTDKETGEKKTSYAYRLIFQSFEKTLSEEEINKKMSEITEALNSKDGWTVR